MCSPMLRLRALSSYRVMIDSLKLWAIPIKEYTMKRSCQVSGEHTPSQRMEVACLFIDCGFAVKMDYTPSESSANITPYVLSNYFGYDADLMQDVSRSSFTQAQWNALIDNELLAKRPFRSVFHWWA